MIDKKREDRIVKILSNNIYVQVKIYNKKFVDIINNLDRFYYTDEEKITFEDHVDIIFRIKGFDVKNGVVKIISSNYSSNPYFQIYLNELSTFSDTIEKIDINFGNEFNNHYVPFKTDDKKEEEVDISCCLKTNSNILIKNNIKIIPSKNKELSINIDINDSFLFIIDYVKKRYNSTYIFDKGIYGFIAEEVTKDECSKFHKIIKLCQNMKLTKDEALVFIEKSGYKQRYDYIEA